MRTRWPSLRRSGKLVDQGRACCWGDGVILGRHKFEFLVARSFVERVSCAAEGWLGDLYGAWR